jgi:Cu/Ag efflux protein CusF
MFTRLVAFVLVIAALACSKKPAEFTVAHRYTLTGTVVSVNSKEQTASIDSEAIPNYMAAMRMDYPVKSKAEFEKLRPGQKIKATLNVNASNTDYNLTGIEEQHPGSNSH